MILVTGGTGLVGSHLLYQLTKNNDTVKAMYRTENKLEKVKKVFSFYTDDFLPLFNKIEWIKADINDITSLYKVFNNDISHVYHCAALVSFNPKDYLKMRKTNIEGTANIINFCIDYDVKKLCYVSSIAALGNTLNNKPISEENERNELQKSSGYSITKYGAEMEVWRASQENIDVVIVNPGVILGSGFFNQKPGKLFAQIHNGFKFYTEGITGFVGIKDVVTIMMELMNSNIKNERYILVSENKSFKDVFFTIADNFNTKRPSIKIGKYTMEVFWRLDWFITKITGKKPLLTRNTAKASYNKEYYSAEKIKKELHYNFESVEVAIKNVCKNYSS